MRYAHMPTYIHAFIHSDEYTAHEWTGFSFYSDGERDANVKELKYEFLPLKKL